MLYRVHLAWVVFELTTLVLIDTDYCIGSYKSNYHMITTTTASTYIEYDRQRRYIIIISTK